MELSVEARGIILGVFLGAVLLIVYLQMRAIKDRGSRIEAKVERDDLYNSLITARAVSRSLRSQGRDTTEAESVIEQAELAYQARNDVRCRGLVTRARCILESTREMPFTDACPKEPEVEVIAPDRGSLPLPSNYVQAKFMMGMVGEKAGKGTEKALELLTEAERRFQSEDYDACLALSNQALKALCEEAAGEVESGGRGCPHCGAGTREDDLYCGRCGREL